VETKPFINQLADISDTQTFPLRFKQQFGLPGQLSLSYPLSCWYQRFFLVEQIPSSCRLLMDRDAIIGEACLYLNGVPIAIHDFTPMLLQGRRFLVYDIQSLLKSGSNVLIIHSEVQHDGAGIIDPLYLSGPFGVSIDETGLPVISNQPTHGTPQSSPQSGYLYYGGTFCFTNEIVLKTLPHEQTFELVLQGWDEHIRDCVEVLVNGHSLGVCCWLPYRWKGTSAILKIGNNSVEIRQTNTLSGMLDGLFFDERTHQMLSIETWVGKEKS